MTRIKINLDAMESLNFFWQSLKDREKASEQFLADVANLEGYRLVYDDEFTPESVRRVMSALSNFEPFRAESKKEGRLYSNHLWMMDDLDIAQAMLQPIKLLNLDELQEKLGDSLRAEEVTIYFVPFHTEAVVVKGNQVVMNFFKVMIDMMGGDDVTFEGLSLPDAVEKVLREYFSA